MCVSDEGKEALTWYRILKRQKDRTLIRVRIEDAELAEKRVTTLMGDKVAPRRKWIEENVQFTLSDDEESDQLMENRGQKAKTPTINTWNQK